jgi:hypothetical protein
MKRLVAKIAALEGLDRPAIRLQQVVTHRLDAGGDAVRHALGGTWLGHPVHPLLTDVVVGSYTAAWFLDLLEAAGRTEMGPAADACLALGALATPITALTGAHDWREAPAGARRVGLLHAGANTVASAFVISSMVMRATGHRTAGRRLANAGFAAMTVAGHLGGALAFEDELWDAEPTRFPEPVPAANPAEDPVTYASWESFPASDAPAWR